MAFKPWQVAVFRFIVLYVTVQVILVADLLMFGPFTFSNYSLRSTVIGIGGVFVALLMTRFGAGYAEDGTFYSAGDEAELKRKSRRGWMFAALWVALTLLFTAGVGGMYF